MNVNELLSKQDIVKLLDYYKFDEVKEDGNKIRACCKIHGGSNPSAFVLDTESNLYFCHTGCGRGGDIFTLVMEMEKISFIESVRFIAEFYNIDISNMTINERQNKELKSVKDFMKMVNSKKIKKVGEYTPRYIRKDVECFREFTEATINHFGMFYVEEIDITRNDIIYTVKNKLFFPIMQNDIIIGALLRRVNNKDKIKWSNQPEHIKTGEIVYNYDNAKGNYDIVVVEGLTDVWAFHEIGVMAVATFGAHLSKEQSYLLIKTGARITLCYDADTAGKTATEKAIKMLSKKTDLFVIELDEGTDPESITRGELKIKYENRRRI